MIFTESDLLETSTRYAQRLIDENACFFVHYRAGMCFYIERKFLKSLLARSWLIFRCHWVPYTIQRLATARKVLQRDQWNTLARVTGIYIIINDIFIHIFLFHRWRAVAYFWSVSHSSEIERVCNTSTRDQLKIALIVPMTTVLSIQSAGTVHWIKLCSSLTWTTYYDSCHWCCR